MATTIRILKEHHFALDSKDLITLKFDDVILVFFDDRTEVSDTFRAPFIEAGEKAAGPVYAICDVKTNDAVASNFFRLKSEPNNPFYWAAQNFPFILVYRSGWPQAFYNGDLDPELLRKYSMELAGQPTYYEKILNERGISKPVAVTNLPPGNLPTGNTPINIKNKPQKVSEVIQNAPEPEETLFSKLPAVTPPNPPKNNAIITGAGGQRNGNKVNFPVNETSHIPSNTRYLPQKTFYLR